MGWLSSVRAPHLFLILSLSGGSGEELRLGWGVVNRTSPKYGGARLHQLDFSKNEPTDDEPEDSRMREKQMSAQAKPLGKMASPFWAYLCWMVILVDVFGEFSWLEVRSSSKQQGTPQRISIT